MLFISLCKPRFSSDVIFLLSEGFTLILPVVQFCWWWVLSLLCVQKILYFTFVSESFWVLFCLGFGVVCLFVLLDRGFQVGRFSFSFQYLKDVTPLSSCLHCFQLRNVSHIYFCPFIWTTSFCLLMLLIVFSLSLILNHLIMVCLDVVPLIFLVLADCQDSCICKCMVVIKFVHFWPLFLQIYLPPFLCRPQFTHMRPLQIVA